MTWRVTKVVGLRWLKVFMVRKIPQKTQRDKFTNSVHISKSFARISSYYTR